jgi:hypothetical protein
MVNSIAMRRTHGKTRRRAERNPGKRFFRLADGTLVCFERREGIVDADDIRQGRAWLTFAQNYLDSIVLPTGVWATPRLVWLDDKHVGNEAGITIDLLVNSKLCRERLGWLRHFIADQLGRRLYLETADDGEPSWFGCWNFHVQCRLFRHTFHLARWRRDPWSREWYDAFLDGERE